MFLNFARFYAKTRLIAIFPKKEEKSVQFTNANTWSSPLSWHFGDLIIRHAGYRRLFTGRIFCLL